MANVDDKVALANQALNLLGAKTITVSGAGGFDSGTKEADLLNSLYDFIRKALLRSHIWNFAIHRAVLSANSPVDSYTTLLLHMNGEDASTTFTDDGNTGHTITVNGDAQIDTAQKKFKTGSGLFDGTGDYVTAPDHADWFMSTGEFTIDFWVRFSDVTGSQGFFGQSESGDERWELSFNGSSKTISLSVRTGASSIIDITGTFEPSAYTWYHIAVIRGWGGNTDDWAITVDGTAVATGTDNDAIPDYTAPFSVGGSRIGEGSPYYLHGHIDEFRVSKGIARETANFTPPAGEYVKLSSVDWGYTYAYELPADCLRTLKMEDLSYEFKIEHGYLLTDESEAGILYIVDEETVATFDELFKEAFVAKLAAEMCFTLTHSASLTKLRWDIFNELIKDARSIDAQEGTPDELEITTWLDAR